MWWYVGRDVLEYIAICPPPFDVAGRDNCLWRPHKAGKFSVKATYNSLVQMDDQARASVWSGIWKTNLPPRMKHFLWLVLHQNLLTNFERAAKRNLSLTTGCTLCGDN
ncbi:hypothetical protein Gotri_002005 [Gossypium trilobum]|uniref:Reverse transcriptase zinc-binding domain-containing protein n=1 Tax=Gossypium trilobum TaxID=34281 RepID=A0A7J9F912_9ROSI|nr:hypothetical protein [Gossypium trilobum]